MMAEKVFTFEEVSRHNKLGDCWLIISGKVYDVSNFLEEHPGGEEVLLTSTGKDATAAFEDVGHSSDAMKQREEFVIGHIDESSIPGDAADQYMRRADFSPASKSSTDSYTLWFYVLPLLIIGVALFLHFYSKKKNEEV